MVGISWWRVGGEMPRPIIMLLARELSFDDDGDDNGNQMTANDNVKSLTA